MAEGRSYINSHIRPGEGSRELATVVAGVVRRYMDLEKKKWLHRNITKLGGIPGERFLAILFANAAGCR